jgi:hypothetical protein
MPDNVTEVRCVELLEIDLNIGRIVFLVLATKDDADCVFTACLEK